MAAVSDRRTWGPSPTCATDPPPMSSSSGVHPPSGPISTVGRSTARTSPGTASATSSPPAAIRSPTSWTSQHLRQPHPAALHAGAPHDASEPFDGLQPPRDRPAHHAPGAVERHDAVDPDLRQRPNDQVGAVALHHGEADRQRRRGLQPPSPTGPSGCSSCAEHGRTPAALPIPHRDLRARPQAQHPLADGGGQRPRGRARRPRRRRRGPPPSGGSAHPGRPLTGSREGGLDAGHDALPAGRLDRIAQLLGQAPHAAPPASA